MQNNELWELFMKTGLPGAYTLFAMERRKENAGVHQDKGHRPQGDDLSRQ